MKIYLFKSTFLLLFFLFPKLVYSQTYITPSFGRNLTFLEGERYCSQRLEKGFKSNSWFAGLGIQQDINSRFNISLNSNITKKTINYIRSSGYCDDNTCDTINNIELSYKQLNTSILLNYSNIKNLNIGFGFNFR